MTAKAPHELHVLVIDENLGDSELVPEMLRRCSSHTNVHIRSAALSNDGLRHLAENAVDVVLLGVEQADNRARTAVTAVLEKCPSTPVIVLSATHDVEAAARMVREGAHDCLAMVQIDPDQLMHSICCAIARKHSEEKLRTITEMQRLLLSELNHRMRNNLTALLALIDIGQRQYDDVAHFAESMRSRVQTMATVHGLLSRAEWTSICLERLLRSLIAPEHHHRITIEGPKTVVSVKQANAFGMVLHEFIANSVKYGALSNDSGTLSVRWKIDTESVASADSPGRAAPRTIRLEWRERNGPPVTPPKNVGVGTRIIEGLARAELQGKVELDFRPDGVAHRLHAVLHPDDDLASAASK
jgi:two-component sensor histidine kinase